MGAANKLTKTANNVDEQGDEKRGLGVCPWCSVQSRVPVYPVRPHAVDLPHSPSQIAAFPVAGGGAHGADEMPEGLGSYLTSGPGRRPERNGPAEQAMWGGGR